MTPVALRLIDARWIIDTSGAYIPGHGTPTCLLVHRARPPVGETVTVIRGNRGEPHVPEDPARGLVWKAIEDAVDAGWPGTGSKRVRTSHGTAETPPRRCLFMIHCVLSFSGRVNAPPHQTT
ncbi:hypothetical protein GCM10009647_076720 [Streptomyces sanglieri]